MPRRIYEVRELLKKLQLGDYLDPEDVDVLETNKEYLRAARTLFYEVLNESIAITENPSPQSIEERRNRWDKKIKLLAEKKERGEVASKERFATTLFFERNKIEKEDEYIMMLLLSKRGVGVRVDKKEVSGEVLIMSLNLIAGIDCEDARRKLNRSSYLVKEGYIRPVSSRQHLPRHPLRDEITRRRSRGESVEETHFELSEFVVDALYGDDTMEYDERVDDHGKHKNDKLWENVEVDIDLEDVVLPHEHKESVMSLLEQHKNSDKFFDQWNLGSIMGKRKGLNLLLSGAPGTGKTMLAKAIASELNMELFMVSFSDLVDSFYGNTEKNAARVLDIVKEGKGILLLDEADAILQRRSPSYTSCDRSENRIVNIVLQGLENHDGIVIFTTNIAIGLDRAMDRRMDLKLELPLPDADARRKIWRYHLPEELPVADDVDLDTISAKYEFSGGHIRNAVLNAARRAIREKRESVNMEDILNACEQEIKGEKAMNYHSENLDEKDIRGYT